MDAITGTNMDAITITITSAITVKVTDRQVIVHFTYRRISSLSSPIDTFVHITLRALSLLSVHRWNT